MENITKHYTQQCFSQINARKIIKFNRVTKTEVPEVSNISNSEQKALFDSKILQWPSGAHNCWCGGNDLWAVQEKI